MAHDITIGDLVVWVINTGITSIFAALVIIALRALLGIGRNGHNGG